MRNIARKSAASHLAKLDRPRRGMFERLLRIARLCDPDDQNNGRFLVTVRPGSPDILQRHRIVVLQLRVGAPLDYASSNPNFRVGIDSPPGKVKRAGRAGYFFL
jgi:hypothetical protein